MFVAVFNFKDGKQKVSISPYKPYNIKEDGERPVNVTIYKPYVNYGTVIASDEEKEWLNKSISKILHPKLPLKESIKFENEYVKNMFKGK